MLHLARASGEDHASTGVPPQSVSTRPMGYPYVHISAKQPAHSREVLPGTPIYTVYEHNITTWVECENKDIYPYLILYEALEDERA